MSKEVPKTIQEEEMFDVEGGVPGLIIRPEVLSEIAKLHGEGREVKKTADY